MYAPESRKSSTSSFPRTTNPDFEGLPTGHPENTNLRSTKSKSYEAPGKPRSRQRRQSEKAALDLLRKAQLRFGEWESAVRRIRRAPRPMTVAKRIIAHAQLAAIAEQFDHDEVDLSDVQALRAKYIRRHGLIDQPQRLLLARMDRQIAIEGMIKGEFAHFAATLFGESMKPALPERVRRKSKTGIVVART